MKNHANTKERSPITESTPTSRRPQPLLVAHPWLIVVGFGLLSMAIATVAIFSLTSIGRVEKDPAKQTTIANQTQNPPANRRRDVSINWWVIVGLLGAGAASVIAVYKWQHLSSPKRGLTRRQQRKLRQQSKGANLPIETEIAAEHDSSNPKNFKPTPELIEDAQLIEPVLMDVTPTIAVLSPEAEGNSDLNGQSLAEMMDIRKHLSLAEILQDFKRPD